MNCPVCQSCGMPLHHLEMHGTDREGSLIEDYCLYCYKDGQFTSDVTMEEMIDLCVKYLDNASRKEAEYGMKIQFPKLKRWAQKEETQTEYYKSIKKVLDYINEHLSEKPDLETLAGIANISSYHFHRIFKGVIGENLGEYVQRIRLEYVARMLRKSSLSLDTLAERAGYNSQQALSKAFKKYFGIPPSVYKNNLDKLKNGAGSLTARVCKIAPKKILYVNTIEDISSETYDRVWRELYMYAIFQGVYSDTSESMGVSFYDSMAEGGNYKFHVCITTENEVKSTERFICRDVEGGLYVIITHQGTYEELHDIYKKIWFEWLPFSKYRVRKGAFFEKYLNNPDRVEQKDILTEIYVPVDLK